MIKSKIEIEKIAKQYGIIPNDLLGQHFIIENNFLNKMVADINDNTVAIEIGPGLGQLTEMLAHKAKKVIAIEIDKQFEKPLIKLKKKYKNIELVFENALSITFDRIVFKERKLNNNIHIVSNLPYHIIEPFIKKVAGLGNLKTTLMVGKKFGYQSQIKKPTDPNFSKLSYICMSFFKVKKLIDVPKNSFWPTPKTDSVILNFAPKSTRLITNRIDFVNQHLILEQRHGTLIKNALMKAFQKFEKLSNSVYFTKNNSRAIIETLLLPNEILNKSFSQLNNKEVRILASSLEKLN